MGEIDIRNHRVIPDEIAEAIKFELSLEGRAFGTVNPKFNGQPLFIDGKKGGKDFYWAYVEDSNESSHHLLILGSPLEWIRLFGAYDGGAHHSYKSHNANVEFGFSSAKVTRESDGEESPFHNWHMHYHPFTEIVTPMNNGTYLQNLKDRVMCSISGQGNGERTYWDNNWNLRCEHIPNPLNHMSESQVINFYKDFVKDLSVASPTAARFIGEKLPLLKID